MRTLILGVPIVGHKGYGYGYLRQRVAAGAPSTADVVHQVLRSAEHPLTFEEVFARVNAHQPVSTRDPRATVRGALTDRSW